MSAQLDERMARAAWNVLREMRDTDPVRYRELFANLIPLMRCPAKSIQTGSLK